MFVLKCWM